MKESQPGHYHPLSIAQRDIARIFSDMGFAIAEGPEVETEFYNFDALNIPADHPARDMWDTFWLKPEDTGDEKRDAEENPQPATRNPQLLLRTHTSPVQVRYMQANKPPIRIIAPGKVYRYEATDATHEAQFYQLEGLMVAEDTTMGTLKSVLEQFFRAYFGEDAARVRLRPSFFPFVEPGLEVDMGCFLCKGQGCGVCKHTGWIEIMGAGMVHPRVLLNVGIDPRKYRGFAFGAGIDRLIMLKHGLTDVRELYTGDLRITNQF